jgi:PASTA domain
MRTALAPLAAAMVLAMGACGSDDGAPAPPTSSKETEALQERLERLETAAKKREAEAARKLNAAREKARNAERKARDAKRRQAKAREEASRTDVDDGGGETGGGIVVPDVTGLDHQAAQDAMQGEGLWLLDEEDCTGQGRALLFDRNWEVVSTDPPAGTSVSEDATITLCSKKQGE